jgi:ribosomal protein S18 acetylase RimI-like enzyme
MSSSELEATFQVRRATAADNVLLADLGAETFAHSFGAANTLDDMREYLAASFSPSKQARELEEPASSFLILEHEGETVGYARLSLGPAPSSIAARKPMEIVRFYSRKEWIGKGVGPALMQECLNAAVSFGCDAVWLSVWDRNPRAIAFYRKWGFEQVGMRKFRLGSDLQNDLVMARAMGNLPHR